MSTMTAAPRAAIGTPWQIDPAHSSVEFAVRHLVISTVRGRFGTVSGTLSGLDGADAQPTLEVNIDAASIDTGNAQRDEHLRSADFFDVATFPTLTFRSRRVEGSTEGDFTVVGDLTMHGVTREVALHAERQGETVDPWGNERVGFSATAKVKRSDFGLTWNQVLETGGVMVGEDVKIILDVALVRPTA